jgi:peptidoglycan/LPS O-acetylase OafA/YrhL
VLVLPLVITQLMSSRQFAVVPGIVVAACVLMLMIPASRRFAFVEQWPAWMQNLAYSRYLFATVILTALPPSLTSGDRK